MKQWLAGALVGIILLGCNFLKTPAKNQPHVIFHYFQWDVHLKYLFLVSSTHAPRLHSTMLTSYLLSSTRFSRACSPQRGDSWFPSTQSHPGLLSQTLSILSFHELSHLLWNWNPHYQSLLWNRTLKSSLNSKCFVKETILIHSHICPTIESQTQELHNCIFQGWVGKVWGLGHSPGGFCSAGNLSTGRMRTGTSQGNDNLLTWVTEREKGTGKAKKRF